MPEMPEMRVFIVTIGTRGDVLPFVAIAQELLARGHAVAIATHAEFGPLVTRLAPACDFVELTGSPTRLMQMYPEAFLDGDINNEFAFVRKLGEEMAGNRERIWEAMVEFKAKFIISMMSYHLECSSMAVRLGVPAVVCCTYPVYPTKERAPLVLGVREFPLVLSRLFGWIGTQLSFRLMKPELNSWRQSVLGLEPLNAFSWNLSPQLNLFSSLLAPRPSDWPGYIYDGAFCRPHSSLQEPSPELAAFIAAGPSPIYLGFGSMRALRARQQWQVFADVCRVLGRRGIFSGPPPEEEGEEEQSEAELEKCSHVLWTGAVPHEWLLPQCCGAVIHGGAGTTGVVLAAGIPCVIFPCLSSLLADQLFWARRCAALGVGPPQVVLARDFGRVSLEAQLRAVLDDSNVGLLAQQLGQELRAETVSGAKRAAAVLESLYTDMHPTTPLDDHWPMREADTPACVLCQVDFGFFSNRRRRCSGCGVFACSACMTERRVIMNFDTEQLVCPVCAQQLGRNGTTELIAIRE